MTRHVPDRVEGAITVRAPAKVNLHLGVGRPREDGFHPLVTVYQAVGLYDDLAVTADPAWSLELAPAEHVDPTGVPLDETNLVHRAARLLAARAGRSDDEVTARVQLTKQIPVAGGMAGGSADAAAALVALDRLWDLGTSDDDLLALAAELGSDVPFALLGGTALGTGRGEQVSAVADEGPWWWVLVPSATGLSTPAVYRRFDELTPDAPAEPPDAGGLLAALDMGDAVILGEVLHNDLQAAALDLRPELGALLRQGEDAGAVRGIVSGSGPTCAFLCASGDDARGVAAELAGRHPVVLVANGPVGGTHLVDYA